MRWRAALAGLLMTSIVLAGCASSSDDPSDSLGGRPSTGRTAFERVALNYNVTDTFSHTLATGPYEILPGTGHFVSVALPITELGATVLDPAGPRIHLGLFLPDVPEGTLVPVIADVGPYYSSTSGLLTMDDPTAPGSPINQPEGDRPATEPANRLGRFLIENFVPHGYAVAQVSVLGSGDANHCFDMFGHAEQLGVDAAVEWLGTQAWSNGNVALIGRSYDGSTPWQAATFGNPHLKSIVPISGLHGLRSLVTHNGSSEARVATFQNVVYGQFGLDGDAGDLQTACPDWFTATPYGAAAFLTGDEVLPTEDSYWVEREFLPRVLENYEGSVYFIHGLQDWNVDPHMITPTFEQLRAKGLDVKGLFGQWGHMYPDRPGEHANLPDGLGGAAFPFSVRYDWAEDLKEWFDHYLKNEGPKPLLTVEVQDNIGRWRVEESYPVRDVEPRNLDIPGATATLQPVPGGGATYDLGVLDPDAATTLSGHLYLEAGVTALAPNAQIYFQVNDATSGLRIAFGTMDFRYRTEPEASPTLTPGQNVILRVESQPMEFVVPKGNRLELIIAQTGEGYLPAPTAGPALFNPGQSTLTLPVLVRDGSTYFTPPTWEGSADATPPQP
ncbi:MAG: CocE/NonD family hydrolase [Candidatus Thermoplasmatota archaeon]